MTWSESLSVLSILVAGLSALYARHSWQEAIKANTISNHERKREIYNAFDTLKFAMLREACGINHESVGKFYQPSRDSEFYFSEKTHNKINRYFHVCFELAELNRKKSTRDNDEITLSEIHSKQDALLNEETRLSKEIDEELRNLLKLPE
ncbi:hypothetical protein [Candidatus Thiosymbion oneisti]|uniref:hypothetical protein n=1 Tax=Candidatus Thiosymbion oneisti TaxID=589554 RepID=UPI00114D14CC|nr:hypothetical protein [Candidatus Thiosymbion oneisti]